MVQLYNIYYDGRNISCDYEPEGSRKLGKVVVDVNSHKMVDVVFSDYEYGKQTYVSYVCSKLVDLLNQKDLLPSTAAVVWY